MTAPDFTVRRSIPTRYNGVLYRSKLEADYARAFDALGIAHRYEREGMYFGDQFFLVDFWLPRSKQWVEVKGVFEPDDVRKIAALLEHVAPRPFTHDECPDIAVVACMAEGQFFGWERGACRSDASLLELSQRACKDLALLQCTQCHGWWFADESMSFRCQCCGAYDGDRYLAERIASPLPGFPHLHDLRPLGHHD